MAKKTPEEIVKGLRGMAADTSMAALASEKETCRQAADLIEDLQKKPEVKKDTLITNQ